MAEKIYYSMGEVAEMFDVNQSLIRHWQTQFGNLIRPERNKKGNRLFTPRDVDNIKLIYHLVKERGLTLDGAKKAIRQQRTEHKGVPRGMELLERLQRIRSLLVEVREDLKTTEGEVIVAEEIEAIPSANEVVEQVCKDETGDSRLRGNDDKERGIEPKEQLLF